MFHISKTFHETTTDPSSSRDALQLVPMPDSYDLDRGLLLSVQAIQVCVGMLHEKIIFSL